MKEVQTQELADFLGLTARRVTALEKESEGFARAKIARGKWDCALAIQAYIEHLTRDRSISGGGGLAAEQERLTMIRADREELKLMQERGELVQITKVKGVLRDKMVKTRTNMLVLSRRLASLRLPGDIREREAVFQREIELALNELGSEGALND